MADIQLKNAYNADFYHRLAEALQRRFPPFAGRAFAERLLHEGHEALALKQRMHAVAVALHDFLPLPYAQQIELLKGVAVAFEDSLQGLVFPDFVETYGLAADDYATSMEALAFFTPLSSSEFGVRPFIERYPERTMAEMARWARHGNAHVRRLASEGCRPRLPWGKALPAFKADPSPIWPILEQLKGDESLYVRRSVANNLNDIAKDHPEAVLERAASWWGHSEATDWVVKHGLRTLLKRGDERALQLIGYEAKAHLEVHGLEVVAPTVAIGEQQTFAFELHNTSDQKERVRLEYAVYYRKANGEASRKVFQLGTKEVEGHSRVAIQRRQTFREMTTRKHYPGTHDIAIIVNGMELARCAFELVR